MLDVSEELEKNHRKEAGTMENQRLEYLVEEHSSRILRLAYSYLKNIHDAQDVMQNVLEKLYIADPDFKDSDHEKAYIIRMTGNMCKNMLKSPQRKNTSLEFCYDVAAPEEEDGTVLWAVNQLKEKYRIVLYLHYYEGYKASEIGKMLGILTPSVHSRMQRGREQLKKILEKIEEVDCAYKMEDVKKVAKMKKSKSITEGGAEDGTIY